MTIQNAFRMRREALGLTQTEVATRAGVSQVSISELELGKSTNPSWDLLSKVAAVLRVRPEELIPPAVPGEIGERRSGIDRRRGGRRRQNRESQPDRRKSARGDDTRRGSARTIPEAAHE